MDNKNIIYVTEEMEGSRIDKFLSEQFSDLTRSYIQKLLKSNSILVNNTPVKASYKALLLKLYQKIFPLMLCMKTAMLY